MVDLRNLGIATSCILQPSPERTLVVMQVGCDVVNVASMVFSSTFTHLVTQYTVFQMVLRFIRALRKFVRSSLLAYEEAGVI